MTDDKLEPPINIGIKNNKQIKINKLEITLRLTTI